MIKHFKQIERTLCLLCFAGAALADNHENEARYQNLTHELRCLVCQNENLADSDAPLAKDLRNQISQKISSGQSDQKIIEDLTDRYGEFILFKPSLSQKNLLLWVAPFFLAILAIATLALSILRHKKRLSKITSLTTEEKQKLEQSL